MAQLPLPKHLAGNSTFGIADQEPVAQFGIGPLKNFVYLILDWSAKKAAVIDPERDLSPWHPWLSKNGFQLEAILLTHTHHDHVGGLDELVREHPGIPIYVHPKDRDRIRYLESKGRLEPIQDQDEIQIGKLSLLVWHTPGHSPGECSFILKHERTYLFSGDTLFIRDCGRTDFVGGSNEQMFESLQRFKTLSPEIILLPGHHYAPETASTMEREFKTSPPLLCKNIEELKALP